MDTKAQPSGADIDTLAQDAQALLDATTEVAGERVAEARRRLSAALQRGREACNRVREMAVEGAKKADRAVHQHPYQAIAVALGLGALVGYLLGRRGSRNRD
jgi:ElaB/YqjD/DUF883 family membrane-anchored ribosome-binding protein